MTPILILAAGTASRMRGADKMLEDARGMPLLRRQTLMAHATGYPVYVAIAPQMPARLDVIADLEATPLIIPEAAQGLSGTLRGAIAQLPQCAHFMIMPGDLVALTTDDLRSVLDAQRAHPDHIVWRGATDDGKLGHPVLLDQSVGADFATLTGDQGGDSILRPLRDQTYIVKLPDKRARFDLDTPEDWAAWRATFS